MSNKIVAFVSKSRRLVVLTGAGVSTASGIPDYRGPNGIYVKNKDYKPIQYRDFMDKHAFRQRYWARSFLGWPRISNAQQNPTHIALRSLQDSGHINTIVTQNVDGLHGQQSVVELHGTLVCYTSSLIQVLLMMIHS